MGKGIAPLNIDLTQTHRGENHDRKDGDPYISADKFALYRSRGGAGGHFLFSLQVSPSGCGRVPKPGLAGRDRNGQVCHKISVPGQPGRNRRYYQALSKPGQTAGGK